MAGIHNFQYPELICAKNKLRKHGHAARRGRHRSVSLAYASSLCRVFPVELIVLIMLIIFVRHSIQNATAKAVATDSPFLS
jgi:hypothetical protein